MEEKELLSLSNFFTTWQNYIPVFDGNTDVLGHERRCQIVTPCYKGVSEKLSSFGVKLEYIEFCSIGNRESFILKTSKGYIVSREICKVTLEERDPMKDKKFGYSRVYPKEWVVTEMDIPQVL